MGRDKNKIGGCFGKKRIPILADWGEHFTFWMERAFSFLNNSWQISWQISLDSMHCKYTEKFMPILYNAMGEYNIFTLKEIW